MKNTMQTYLSLLRAVNVLGKNLVKMPELVRILEKSGFNNVRTYIQSGNIIFSSGEKSCDILAGIIRETITKHWGFTVQVLVLTPHEMSEIVSNNPFAARKGIDHSRMHVTILDRVPDRDRTEKLLAYDYPPDEIIISGRAAYLHCPEGYGRTKYNTTFIEKKLELQATSRNWNSCLRLLELCQDLQGED
jgi:uncharacterized protein (DUF1697 family)